MGCSNFAGLRKCCEEDEWAGGTARHPSVGLEHGLEDVSMEVMDLFTPMTLLIGTYDRIFATCCMLTWISGPRSELDQLWVATSLCSLFSIRYLYGGEERGGLVPAAACGSSF